MPTFNSWQLIIDLQKQTETILDKAITTWQMTSTDVMLFKPGENAWSATQCLMHLNSYWHYYLPAIQQSIEKAERRGNLVADTFTTSWIGNWFTEMMQPKGATGAIRKMKSPKEHAPQTNLNPDAVLAEFIEQQETLLKLLDRAQALDMRKAKTPISISRFIKLPLGDTFRFLIAHNNRHVLQAERAITAARESVVV